MGKNSNQNLESRSMRPRESVDQLLDQAWDQETLIEHRITTYTSQGMSSEDAQAYIQCLKMQEVLCQKLKLMNNQNNHGGPNQ